MSDWHIAWRDVVRLVRYQSPSKFLGLRRVQEMRLRGGMKHTPHLMQQWLFVLTFIPHCIAVALQVIAWQRHRAAFRRETMRIAHVRRAEQAR